MSPLVVALVVCLALGFGASTRGENPTVPEQEHDSGKWAPGMSKLDQMRIVRRLTKAIDSPEDNERLKAIEELRRLARRVDRSGGQRQQHGDPFEPKIPGLVPLLLKSAGDKSERNRSTALFALADTLDPAAVSLLRERLKDESEMVRFNAACLLTEFHDASGLPELKKGLQRLRAKSEKRRMAEAGVYYDIERLLSSFERITGKSFGTIPLNPSLVSFVPPGQKSSEQRYGELLDAWAAWWEWTPPQK